MIDQEYMSNKRKDDHIRICLNEDVNARYNYWDDVSLIHNALPEIDKAEVDLETELFGKKLKAPIIISAITGGYKEAEKINRNLAEAAAALGLGLGLGSQRPALKDPTLSDSYSVIKEYSIPLVIGNIGVPQLIAQKGAKEAAKGDLGTLIDYAKTAMDMIEGDVLAVHLNYLQEVVQPEGDTNARGGLEAIRDLVRNVEFPILAKETGAGISAEVGLALKNAGVTAIDVGGMGGTSFAAVEYYRAKEVEGAELYERLGKTFWDWGIPTPASVVLTRDILPVIATGGIRNGLDIAKTLALGATTAGLARTILPDACKSAQATIETLESIIEELRSAMFLMGANSPEKCHGRQVIFGPELKKFLPKKIARQKYDD